MRIFSLSPRGFRHHTHPTHPPKSAGERLIRALGFGAQHDWAPSVFLAVASSGPTLGQMAYLGGPNWLSKAEHAAKTLKATTKGVKGAHHSVYVVLLHDARRSDPWGLYVGQTSRDPDLRFDQHKSGYKASSAARRFGVRLIPALTEHLNPMRQWESLDLEAALAAALQRIGVPWVEGGH